MATATAPATKPDVTRRARLPDPGVEGTVAARARSTGWPNGPGPRPGPTRSSSPPACNARSPPASPTAARAASAPPGSRPARRLEDFDFDHQRSLKRDVIAHLGTLDFVDRQGQRRVPRPARHRQNPPRHRARRSAPAKPATGSRSPPPPNGSPASPTPTTPAGSTTSSPASAATRCSSSTKSATSPSKPKPPTCSSSSSPPATNAPRVIVTSNKPFGRWGEVFGDDVVAAAMIDRLVHHAEVVTLKGDSYRLKDRDLGRATTTEQD